MNLATTKILAPQLRPNLLPSFCDFDTPHTWNKISGDSDVSVVSSALNPYGGTGHARVNFNITTTAKRIVFSSGGDEMKYTATKTGVHAISFMLWVGSTDTLIVALNVFKNGIATKYETNLTGDLALKVGYNKIYQTFEAELNDEIDFTFELTSDTTRYADIDAMKLEFINDGVYLPSAYSKTPYDKMAWHRTENFVSSQVIPANTPTKLLFIGNERKSGAVSLIANNDGATVPNSDLRITPSRLLSSLGVNGSFTTPTPSGTNQTVVVQLRCNGITYRTKTHHFSKATSIIDTIDYPFLLPVEEDFMQYDGEIFITSTSEIIISNNYLYVNQIAN